MDHVLAQSTQLKIATQTVVPVSSKQAKKNYAQAIEHYRIIEVLMNSYTCIINVVKLIHNPIANCSSLICSDHSNRCQIVGGIAQCMCGVSSACSGMMPFCEHNPANPNDPNEYRCKCAGASCWHPNPICDSDGVCRVITNLHIIIQQLITH